MLSSNKQSLIFSASRGLFFINGEPIEITEKLVRQFADYLSELKLGSIELSPGLDLEEFGLFTLVLTQTERFENEDRIRQFMREKGVQHFIPRFASYKLVREDQKIVKEDEVVELDRLPPAVRERFLQDLDRGAMGEKLRKKEEKVYKKLAHDPEFLAKTIVELIYRKDGAAEVGNVVWLVADYLIGEVDSSKSEKINRKILNDVKSRLIAIWKQKEDKKHWLEETDATFAGIDAVMQLKAVVSLYKRHKKGVESAAGKLKDMLEDLPPESSVYRKTVDNIKKIGMPSLDEHILKLLKEDKAAN